MRSTTFLTRAFEVIISPSTAKATGVFMILTATLLLLRPTAFALEAFEEYYGIVISVQLMGTSFFLGGFFLLLLNRMSHLLLYLLILPISLYVIFLWWAFSLSPATGPVVQAFSSYMLYLIIRDHARELKARGIIARQGVENLKSARNDQEVWDANKLQSAQDDLDARDAEEPR